MTLTNRLLLFHLATLAAVLCCFSIGLYLTVQHHLYGQLDERLDSMMKTLSAAVEEGEQHVEWEPGERHLDLSFGELGSGVVWTVGNERGETIDSAKGAELKHFLSDTSPALRFQQIMPDVRRWQGQNWKAVQKWVYANSFKDKPQSDENPSDRGMQFAKAMSVTVGVSFDNVRRSLHQLVIALTLISCIVWLLAFLSGRLLCRRALSPLTVMTKTVSDVSADDLSQRLPAREPKDELQALTIAFNSLLGRLQLTFERQRAFTGDASHQLRTPIAAILGQTEVSLRKERSPEEYREVLRIVALKAEHVRKIVESLLFLARADADAQIPKGERVRLSQWLKSYAERWSTHVRAKDISINCDVPEDTAISTHEILLGELLSILVDNACKFSDVGTPILLTATRSENLLQLSVTNQGYPIADSERPLLFQPFFRSSDSQRRGIDGMGLGLAIANRLANALEASIEFSFKDRETNCVSIRMAAVSKT